MFRCYCTSCTGYGPKPNGRKWVHLPATMRAALMHQRPRGFLWVYALIDPRTNQIRYIGVTDAPGQRLRNHISSRHEPTARGQWLAELIDQHGLRPRMVLLDLLGRRAATKRESALIRDLAALGTPLTNRQARKA